MDLNAFLETDDRNKYEIGLFLEEKKSNFTSFQMIRENIGISKFKATQYLLELNEDLAEISAGESEILLEDNGEIRIFNVNSSLLKKLRLKYLEQSHIYQLFMEVTNHHISPTEYANKYFISRSNAYNYKKQLDPILKKRKILYKRNQLVGEELEIRNLIFLLYFEFYNGITIPFTAEEDRVIQEMMNRLGVHYQLFFTNTKRYQLYLYLGIIFRRLSRESYMEGLATPIFKLMDTESLKNIFRLAHPNLTDDIVQAEAQPLFLFLYCEELLLATTDNQEKAQLLMKDSDVQLAEMLFSKLTFKNNPSKELYQQYLEKFAKQVFRINLKHQFFYSSTETFSSMHSFLFFIESYPAVIEPLKEVVEFYTSKQSIEDSLYKTRVYYDYLFAFLDVVPMHELEEKIYICVDFSHGLNYTKYIAEQIAEFKSLNIEIQYRMTTKTHLLLSDFALSNVACEQIIWKNPPTADDWEEFGNTIVKIKHDWVGSE